MSSLQKGDTLSDTLYTNVELLRLLQKHNQQNNEQSTTTKEAELKTWSRMWEGLLPDGEASEDSGIANSSLTFNDLNRRPVRITRLAFFDAFENNHKLTEDPTTMKEIPKAPALIRILHTYHLDETDKQTIKTQIKRALTKTLNTRGLAQIPIYMSQNEGMVSPSQYPSVHIGIDYEEIDLRKSKKSNKSDGARTSRGDDVTIRSTRDRTERR